MGKLIQFWQKDIINKLIVLVVLVILLVAGTLIYILAVPPGGRSLRDSFFPTPTLSTDEIFKRGEQTATAVAMLTQAAVVPTITTMPFTPMAAVLEATETATAAGPEPSATGTPPQPLETATPAPTASATRRAVSASANCPPQAGEQTGKVLEIIDVRTIRVLIGDLVYVVRYIGVEPPQDANFADMSRIVNADLVYAKEVKLYAEGAGSADIDDANRLLRYVVVGETLLVNQELISEGWARASDSVYACAGDFLQAEQDAKSGLRGTWKGNSP